MLRTRTKVWARILGCDRRWRDVSFIHSFFSHTNHFMMIRESMKDLFANWTGYDWKFSLFGLYKKANKVEFYTVVSLQAIKIRWSKHANNQQQLFIQQSNILGIFSSSSTEETGRLKPNPFSGILWLLCSFSCNLQGNTCGKKKLGKSVVWHDIDKVNTILRSTRVQYVFWRNISQNFKVRV